MKIDFSPRFFRDLTGIGDAAQAVTGLTQTIGGWIQQNRNTKKLEKLIGGYQPNKSIMDYYSNALQKYNVNPYTSALYNHTAQKVGASTAQGINAFQDRRSANANISTLIQNQNDTLLKAGIASEDQSNQALGRLGQATQMKAAEEKYPFELKANLYGAKATGGAQIMNAGLSNIFGAGQSYSQMEILKKLYGNGNSGGTSRGAGGGW